MTDEKIEESAADKEARLYQKSYELLCKSKPVELFRLCYQNDIPLVDAAKIMGIHQKTLEQHSSKFRKMMNAKTNIIAVIRAINIGIIKKIEQDFELVKLTDRGTFAVVRSQNLR